VLLEEVMGFLVNGPGFYLDATLGDAGHTAALLEREPGARVLGTDRDPEALRFSAGRLTGFGDRVMLAHATFRGIPGVMARAGWGPLSGALFDLGLSSRQIDQPQRGMSFQSEGPLDLRMDPSSGAPAAERLREADAGTIARVLRELGDVPAANRIARALVAEAGRGRLATTQDLRVTIDRALGGRSHPRRYAQVFQALRMWVNDEAGEIQAALGWLPGAMRPGGVVVTIAYHSGEDRLIKQALREPKASGRAARLPYLPGMRPPEGPWATLTTRVVTPSTAESRRNPRARSARLRAFRRKPS
jgi:16S rRNA (cytosine1402-N4)-methyltransferase